MRLLFTIFLLSTVVSRDVSGFKVNDSDYGRFPPLFHLDDFDRCMRQQNGLYCVMNISLSASPDNELMTLIRKHSQNHLQHFNHSNVEHGICVSKQCKEFIVQGDVGDMEGIRVILNKCLGKSYKDEYDLHVNVSQIYHCNRPNDAPEVDLGDWIFGICVLTIITINVVATVYDYQLSRNIEIDNNTTGNGYLLNFSMRRNWKHLMSTDITDPKFELFKGIFGGRTLLTFFMVMGHTMWLNGCGFIDNPRDFEKTHENPFYYVIFNGMMLVQAYFLLSGCFLVYSLCVSRETKPVPLSAFPVILFYRWCRLTVGLAFILGFITTWYRHLGSGPLWNFHVLSVASQCRQNWWSHIFYINNFIEDNLCAIQTWHLAAEMQIFCIALVIVLVAKSRGVTLGISLMFLVGVIAPALYVLYKDMPGVVILYPEFYRTLKNPAFSKMHIVTLNNMSCYAIGMLLGFYIYNKQNKNVGFEKYKILKYISWSTPMLIVLTYMSGGIFYDVDYQPSLSVKMLYAAAHRPVFGAILAYMLLSIVFKFEDVLCSIIEWNGWMITSRLAYSVYLVHVSLIHFLQGSKTQLWHSTFINMLITHFGVLTFSYILAAPLYLLVEVPVISCVKNWLQQNYQATKEQKVE